MTREGALLAIAVFLVSAVPALAQTKSYCATYDLPDRYWTPRFSGDMAYRLEIVDGKRILMAEGGVRSGEGSRLAQALDGYRPVDEVWMNSPGGVAREGLSMGRVLRSRGVLVRLPSHFACVSACSLAFLGGAIRVVDPGAYYGVHMFKGTDDGALWVRVLQNIEIARDSRDAAIRGGAQQTAAMRKYGDEMIEALSPWQQDSAKTAAQQARYLIEMSASLDFLTDTFGTRAQQVCYLSRAGLQHYNVDNSR